MGPGLAMRVQDEVKLCSDVTYYGLCTLIGKQTLGEEYCDIVQVNKENIPPFIWERLMLISWHILIPYTNNKLCSKLTRMSRPKIVIPFRNQERKKYWDWELSEQNKKRLSKILPHLIDFINIFQRVHLGIFYFSGVFYHFSKRLMNIRYIFNRKLDEHRPRYYILGILIFTQLFLSFVIWLKELLQTPDTQSVEEEKYDYAIELNSSNIRCSICLENIKFPTATSCGHLFCWNCITDYCNKKAECPLCRKPQKKNELACVYGV